MYSKSTDETAPATTVDAVIHDLGEDQVFGLVCLRCADEQEAVTAFITLLREPPEHFALCGPCFREFLNLSLGEVI